MEIAEIRSLVEKLSNAHGISGFESPVAKIIKEEVAPYVDEVRTDAMGNLVAVKKGDDFSIMLAAHMDEIGLMVQYVDEHGFIRFVAIGGWFNPVLVSQRVLLHGEKGTVPGVLGMKPPHVMSEEDRKKPVSLADMFIDVGATSPEEVEALGITIGTPITIDREFVPLAGTCVTGKAFDNRAGCVMLIGALREMQTKHTVYAVFTVQEEVGLKGAKTSSFALNPDVQVEIGDGGNTDASAINFERGGIPSVPVSVPARYIHSPVEVIDLKDLQAGISLLAKAVATKPKLN